MVALLPNIGVPELLIVLAIAILILGPKRIPQAAKSVGQGVRNFRDSLSGGDDEKEKSELDEKTKTEA
jgi:sec-independent protein translocase protein TatA